MRRPAAILGSAAALALSSWLLWRHGAEMPRLDLSSPGVPAAASGALALYLLSQVIGAVAWRLLLQSFGAPALPMRAESELMVSQIGKYLPGNLGHLVGRVALARRDAVPAQAVGLALLSEVVLTACACAIVAGLALAFGGEVQSRRLRALIGLGWPLLVVAATCAGLAAALCVPRCRRATRAALAPLGDAGVALLHPAALYALGFVVLGGSLACAVAAVAPGTSVSIATSVAVFATAWLAGFVTPGAPGGLGIRDTLVVAGLAASLGAPAALAVAVLHRCLSVLGDVLILGAGLALRRRWVPT